MCIRDRYLPGDLSQKIDPYLVPLFDSLEYFFGNETLAYLLEKRNIEIVPLAYMRGRTLNNACIILDEAQNATMSQIKMFLTRLGENSKIIITGDESQVDLYSKDNSGLNCWPCKYYLFYLLIRIHFNGSCNS